MPNSSLSDRLSSLPTLTKTALSELWKKVFETTPQVRMQKNLMIRVIAYRIQEKEFGGLTNDTLRRLRELSNAVEASSKTAISRKPTIKPGTRLIRQWKDQVHVVSVEERAYEYRGGRYESLSQIARLITGTRWSGPLFFGLRPNQPMSKEGK